MRKKLVLLLMTAAAASLIALGATRHGASRNVVEAQEGVADEPGASELPERDEVHRRFELRPGAQVQLSFINGSVDVEATDENTAQVDITRSARSRDDLRFDRISIEHTPDSLVLRGADSKSGQVEVRQRVKLLIPRRSNFTVREVNGTVTIGRIDGNVGVRSVNGNLIFSQGGGASDITSVNGHMTISIGQLTDGGIRISDAVSPVLLQVADDINADLNVKELNGRVSVKRSNVTVNRVSETNYSGQIGSGGPSISIVDVRGSLTIASGDGRR